MLIQIDAGNWRVTRVMGNERKTGSIDEPKSHSKFGHQPAAMHDLIQAFLREHDGSGLLYHPAPIVLDVHQ